MSPVLPSPGIAGVITALAFLLSWALTGGVRRYALRSDLLDIPNERSSHTRPTPRGGGVAIVSAFLLAVVAFGFWGTMSRELVTALLGAGVLVASIGFADDRWSVPARWRFGAHLGASLWVLACLHPIRPVSGLGMTVHAEVVLWTVFALYVTWSINLFNFMDGIDGIAAAESICVALGSAGAAWMAGVGDGVWAGVLLAACTAGFLVWNWPPARIFMGDAGSGFLGLMAAALTLWSAQRAPQLLWSGLILAGCFNVDATTTLIRRVRRGERFYVAHRSHAYQYASRRLGRHLPVTLACVAINLGWLLPIAILVALRRVDGVAALLVAYAPLIVLAVRLRAGDRRGQGE